LHHPKASPLRLLNPERKAIRVPIVPVFRSSARLYPETETFATERLWRVDDVLALAEGAETKPPKENRSLHKLGSQDVRP
jgi:hypothetical protein